MPFDREWMKQEAATLAGQGVFVGTSSWKYEGWFGQLYTPARYEYRGKVAKTRFEGDCLSSWPPAWPNGFAEHLMTEDSNDRLADGQTMLREQVSDGALRRAPLSQFRDDI